MYYSHLINKISTSHPEVSKQLSVPKSCQNHHREGLMKSRTLMRQTQAFHQGEYQELVLRQRCSEQAAIITQHHLFPGPSSRVGPDEAHR
ncbi:unnamed protein product [Boreogadus saida]